MSTNTNDELFQEFLIIFDKLQKIIPEKERYEKMKLPIIKEIENINEKNSILMAKTLSFSNNNELSESMRQELEQREQQITLKLLYYKDQENLNDFTKKSNVNLLIKKQEMENNITEFQEKIEQFNLIIDEENSNLKIKENQIITIRHENEINTIKNRELTDKFRDLMQIRNFQTIELENLMQKFLEIKKNMKLNKMIIKNQMINLENLQKSLHNKLESINTLIYKFSEDLKINKTFDSLTLKYNEKINQNNKIREENENLKEKIQKNSVKNLKFKMNHLSHSHKKSFYKENSQNETMKIESIKANIEKINKIIIEINHLQIKNT